MIFSIDGRELANLHIENYSIKTETLDGEGTGRTKAYGWDMVRDPQGQITNLSLTFAATSSNEPDFVFLWQVIRSFGNRDFAPVRFIDPTGGIIEQEMYALASEIRYIRTKHNGVVYTDQIKVDFIAKKGT